MVLKVKRVSLLWLHQQTRCFRPSIYVLVFDRQVIVPLPDVKGREQILKVHMEKVVLSRDANALVIARGTPGFSGADLANLVNEAALFAARSNKRKVSMTELEKAKDKIMMGAEDLQWL